MDRPPFEKRVERIKQYLAERDLRALVVLDDLNTIYVSGFHIDVATWERPVATVIPLDVEPFMILNELSTNDIRYAQEQKTVWIKDLHFYIEHPRPVNRIHTMREWDRLLCELLEDRKILRGRIGVDSKGSWLKSQLRNHLPELEVVDCGQLLREMRGVKDEYELDLIRKACELGDLGLGHFTETIAVGKTALEIAAETTLKLTSDAAERYPEYAIEVRCSFTGTGPFGAMPHGMRFNSRKVQKGESLLAVVIVKLNAYIGEDERTFFTGPPDEKQRKFFEVMKKAQAAGVEQCVAGNKLSDIDSAASKVIEDAGYGQFIFHRTGHGIGLGGHEYPHDMAFSYRTLEPGMVFSVEPAIFVYGFAGFRHSDTVIIGKEKPEVATKFSKELEDLIVAV